MSNQERDPVISASTAAIGEILTDFFPNILRRRLLYPRLFQAFHGQGGEPIEQLLLGSEEELVPLEQGAKQFLTQVSVISGSVKSKQLCVCFPHIIYMASLCPAAMILQAPDEATSQRIVCWILGYVKQCGQWLRPRCGAQRQFGHTRLECGQGQAISPLMAIVGKIADATP